MSDKIEVTETEKLMLSASATTIASSMMANEKIINGKTFRGVAETAADLAIEIEMRLRSNYE